MKRVYYSFDLNWVWRRLVARYLGVVEAAGSSPVTQTIKVRGTLFHGLLVLLRKDGLKRNCGKSEKNLENPLKKYEESGIISLCVLKSSPDNIREDYIEYSVE